MVRDSSSSYIIDYVLGIKNYEYPKGHQHHITGSKFTVIVLKGLFCLLVELNQEGSAPAACADLFIFMCSITVFLLSIDQNHLASPLCVHKLTGANWTIIVIGYIMMHCNCTITGLYRNPNDLQCTVLQLA